MAENSEPPHQQSLYMGKTIEQVSREEQGPPVREVSPSSSSMAVSTLGSNFRLMCPICLQDLIQPKQLKGCYHIFCKDCLQPFVDKAEGGSVTCPLGYCRRPCSKDDISKALRSDTYLLSYQGHIGVYMESGDLNLVCENEDGHEACCFCFECGKNFCDTCQSDHGGMFRDHSVLKLFKTPDTQTISINTMVTSVDEPDMASSLTYKCPICRNTDQCEHENWLKDLLDDRFRKSEFCEIPDHVEGNRLIAYCLHPDCNKPICRNCSMIEHKEHQTMDISGFKEEKVPDLSSVKKGLIFHQDIFEDAAKRCKEAETDFGRHIAQVEQEMISRKASMHMHVQEAFTTAFRLIEQTGQKQAELNRQCEEMDQELQFLKTAIQLAERVLRGRAEDRAEGTASALEFVRVWKGLKIILEDLGLDEGNRKKHLEPDIVLPQDVVEKKLVLPAPSCMNPDLHILQKVGVENKVLRQAFALKADEELLLFYSVLPLTQTEALVSCKPRDCVTTVVQYSNVEKQRHSVEVAEGGVYCTTAVPGEGIVATLYDPPGGCGDTQGKNQILFWKKALGVSMTMLEAQGAKEKTRVIKQTKLPPWGLAVTSDNQVVVCTAEDRPNSYTAPRESCILVMTLQGDVVCERSFFISGAGRGDSTVNFPRYVTVNINDDICVTDEKDQSVIILTRQLRNKLRLINPYAKQDMNDRFAPRGICHDSFGRLVIADPNNHAVLRIEYDDTKMTKSEIILQNKMNKVKDLNSPALVAMGSGATEQSSRLWVVCRYNIQVFEYTDKE